MVDKRIWAPWRSEFILGPKEKGCVFCNRLSEKDSFNNLIVYRGESCLIILNKYPYTVGHALILPYRHIGVLEKLRTNESNELFELTRTTVSILKSTLKPDAFNLGMNLGRSAGAGVPGHLHMHAVPRWNGDTNFMPVVGKTHVASISLKEVYESVRAGFDKL